jgi:hypothetical protein
MNLTEEPHIRGSPFTIEETSPNSQNKLPPPKNANATNAANTIPTARFLILLQTYRIHTFELVVVMIVDVACVLLC